MEYSICIILDFYLGKLVEVVESVVKGVDIVLYSYVKWVLWLCCIYYRLVYYIDCLYKSYEDCFMLSEW